MASLKWSDVPPSSPATERNARGMHYIYFCAPSARAPELMLALPYMSWGTHDGMPTLPWGEGMRILMLMHTMDTDTAEAACVVQSTPQVEKLAPGFDLVVSKLDLSAVVALCVPTSEEGAFLRR